MGAQNYTPVDELVKKHNEMKYGTGSPSKEFVVPSPEHEIAEVEAPVEQVSSEKVEDYAQPKTTSIKLPPDLKKMGVKTSDDNDNQFREALYKIKLPISDEKIMDDLKAKPTESKRWFATILLYILERAHLTLKKIGTKVVRVFKTN